MLDSLLSAYPVVIQIPVAWGEMDAFQHVNNVVYFRYFESARLAYLERLDYLPIMRETGLGPILASAQCRFRAPLTYPDTVHVGVSVSTIETDRMTMRFSIISQRLQKVAAEGEGVIVSYDYRENRKAPLPDVLRQRIMALEASVRPPG
jgi:acyl-CoA thioester hydrolase